MCCCTRIHTRGGGERSISLPSTKGPPRVLSRTKRGGGSGGGGVRCDGEVGRVRKRNNKILWPPFSSSTVHKCPPPFVRGPYQEGSHFPNLFRFTLRTFNPFTPFHHHYYCHNNVPDTRTHARTFVLTCTCAAKSVYSF